MTTLTLEPQGLLARDTLTGGQRDEMHGLLDRHFSGVTRDQFECDLAEKNWVIEVREGGRLEGFTTLLTREVVHEGACIMAIYSGDTIMSPEAWRKPALSRNWIAAVNFLRRQAGCPCHWLLLTSGFRTYRFLPVFWREFFPCFDRSMPLEKSQLRDALAMAQYGEHYDFDRGIVRFPRPQRLRGSLAGVPEGRADDPHIAFFLETNPGHDEGDELVCITEITESNLTAAGWRMVRAK